jgi:hypothetical protein
MLGVTFLKYAECHYAECDYAECHYAECHYAECNYAKCHYTECCGAAYLNGICSYASDRAILNLWCIILKTGLELPICLPI